MTATAHAGYAIICTVIVAVLIAMQALHPSPWPLSIVLGVAAGLNAFLAIGHAIRWRVLRR